MECLTSKYAAMKLLSFYIHAVTLAFQIIITGKTLIEKSGCFTGFLVTRLFHTRSFLGTVE